MDNPAELRVNDPEPTKDPRGTAETKAPRKSRSVLFRLGAVGIGFLISLLIAELVVRLFAPQDLSGTWRIQSPGHGHLINKAGGTARHQLGDRIVHYRFNSLHMRGPEPTVGARRILCLGDSYTFGWRLPWDETYLQLLQAEADQDFGKCSVELLNGGAGGWGAAHYSAFIEEFGDAIRPEMVIVFLNGGDIGRSMSSRLYTLTEPGSLELTANRLPDLGLKAAVNRVPGYQFFLENSHFLQMVRRLVLSRESQRGQRVERLVGLESYDPLKPDCAVDLGNALFRRIDAWCEKRAVPLIVITTGFPLERLDWTSRPTGRFVEQAHSFFRSIGVPFEDTRSELQTALGADVKSFVIEGDGHPNERGARIIAEHAWPRLRPYVRKLLGR